MKENDTKNGTLSWHINSTIFKLEFAIPPPHKIEANIKKYFKARILEILEFYDLHKDGIIPLWSNRDVRFTELNGAPAYTYTSHNEAKPGRRSLKLVPERDLPAWKFDRMIVKLLDEVRLFEHVLDLTIWGLKSHVYTKPRFNKDILNAYQKLYDNIMELKTSLKEWRNKRGELDLPKWLMEMTLEDYEIAVE